MAVEIVCEHCEKLFAPRSAKSRFCSSRCETYAWRAKNKDRYATYMREWAAKNPEQLQQRNLRRQKGWPTIACAQCEKSFQKKGGSNRFCSAKCRGRAYRQQPKVLEKQRVRWNKWANTNRGRVREVARNHYHRHAIRKLSAQPWGRLLLGRSKDAKKRGIPFELTAEWAQQRWTGRCELTRIKFALPENRVGYKNRNFSPSIDKIVPSLGYTQANSRFVLWAVNSLKRDSTDAEMYTIAKALMQHRPTSAEGILSLPG